MLAVLQRNQKKDLVFLVKHLYLVVIVDSLVSGSIFGSSIPFANLSTPNTTSGHVKGNIFGLIDSTLKSTNSNDITNKENATSTLTTAAPPAVTTTTNPDTTNSMFKPDGAGFISFAALAETASATTNNTVVTPDKNTSAGASGFFGLTLQDEFKSFNKSINNTSTNNQDGNDEGENYDPHFEPIIELTKEIVVTTGEENEKKKIFGERATLFGYDATNKEWKERGVDELKILYHPNQGTYRLLLRREQIHKCVLNHAINNKFAMNPMNASQKVFCWATMNYIEKLLMLPDENDLHIDLINYFIDAKYTSEYEF